MATDHDHQHHGGEPYHVHAHISSVKFYAGILGALMFLTVITVALSLIHLGPLNLFIAIAIATVKAALVVLFFMHLRYDNKFNALVFVGSVCFVGVFLAYTINDTGRRAEVDEVNGAYLDPGSGAWAEGGDEMRRSAQAAGAAEGAPPAGAPSSGGEAGAPQGGTPPPGQDRFAGDEAPAGAGEQDRAAGNAPGQEGPPMGGAEGSPADPGTDAEDEPVREPGDVGEPGGQPAPAPGSLRPTAPPAPEPAAPPAAP